MDSRFKGPKFSLVGLTSIHYVHYVLGALFWILNFRLNESHPQCLDHRPPFKPRRALTLCTDYSSYGCCSAEDDEKLAQKFQTLTNRFYYSMGKCRERIKTGLCLQCNPYAAHLYEAEGRSRHHPFPGLCNATCQSFLEDCRHLPTWAIAYTFIHEDRALASLLNSDPQGFCSKISLSDPDYCFPALLTNPILSSDVIAAASDTDGCFCLQTFARDLRNPLLATHAGDGSHRLFVVEQIGVVWVFLQDGTQLPEPFLNITDKVYTSHFAGDERGFLGLAFHPNFRQNNKFYIYYSVKVRGRHRTRISELKVSRNDMNRVRSKSERILVEVVEPYFNHNGGMLHFGLEDNLLYAYIGDGGGAGDWDNHAQNLSSLLGKVIRINVDQTSPGLAYGIPANPFLHDGEARPEIWAYGIRNIWRCGVDRGDAETWDGRGRVICADVGQDKYEEIDLMEEGGNYGWRAREGFECFDEDMCGKIGPEVLPIFAYNHTFGKSVTGGPVYRGCDMPRFNGHYFYGDFLSGRIWRLKEKQDDGENGWENRELQTCGPKKCRRVDGLTWRRSKYILSFGEDEGGEIYLLSTSDFSNDSPRGKVYRFVDPSRRGNPQTCADKRRPTRNVIVKQKNRHRHHHRDQKRHRKHH